MRIGIKKTLASNLRRLMRRDRVLGVDIAKACGVSGSAVTHWTSGDNWPGGAQIDAMMNTFGWTSSELFQGKDSSFHELIAAHNNSTSPFMLVMK